jgi:hypothetical protein
LSLKIKGAGRPKDISNQVGTSKNTIDFQFYFWIIILQIINIW